MKKLLARFEIYDKESFWAFVKQFIKFGIIGLSNTALSMAIYYSLVLLGVHYLIASVVAFILSVLNSFYWNRKYVFKESNESILRQLAKVYSSYGVSGFLSTALLFIMVDIIGLSEFIAPLINLFITVPMNFLLNKFWAFR